MKKSRIIISLALIICMLFTLTACGGGEEEKTSLDVVKESGLLKIGTEGAWPPFIFNDEKNNNELVGFEIEWGEAIAEQLGVKADFNVSSQWDGVIAGLDAERYDCVMCAVAPTDYSSDKYSMSDPYYPFRTVIVAGKDRDDINELADLEGKVLGNSPQGIWGQIAKDSGAEVRNMNLTQAMDNIETGRIDATMNAELSILDYYKAKPDAGSEIKFYYEPKDPAEEKVIILFNQGNDELIAEINNAIKTLLEDGTAKALSEKYFGKNIYEGWEQ